MGSKTTFRVLLIDDDEEMNASLSRRLMGHKVNASGHSIPISVDVIGVKMTKTEPGFWKFADETIEALKAASSQHYDLVMADFGLVDDEAKDILWGKDRTRTPTRDEAKGRLLTIRDLAVQFAASIPQSSRNIFLNTHRVFLRSFASRLAFDLLGPVKPDREVQTKAAFPNAEVDTFDPRNEVYGGDAFYSFYEREDGRAFYRQIICHHAVSVVERYVICDLAASGPRIRLRRSVLNIALFGGCIAAVGGATQYLGGIGIEFLRSGQTAGWWWIVSGLMGLLLGAVLVSAYFETFTRKVIEWVKAEQD